MKSYEQIADSIIEKYNARAEKKRRRVAISRRIAAITFGTAAVLGIGIFTFALRPPKKPVPDPPGIIVENETTSAETTSVQAGTRTTAAQTTVTIQTETASAETTAATAQSSTQSGATAGTSQTTASTRRSTTTARQTTTRMTTTTPHVTTTTTASATTTTDAATTTASMGTTTATFELPYIETTALPYIETTAPKRTFGTWTEVAVSDTVKNEAPYKRKTSFRQMLNESNIVLMGTVTDVCEYQVECFDENGSRLTPFEVSIITLDAEKSLNLPYYEADTVKIFYPYSLSYLSENGLLIRKGGEYVFFVSDYVPTEYGDIYKYWYRNNYLRFSKYFLGNAYDRVMAINNGVVTSYDFTQYIGADFMEFYSIDEVWDSIPQEVKDNENAEEYYRFFSSEYLTSVVRKIWEQKR